MPSIPSVRDKTFHPKSPLIVIKKSKKSHIFASTISSKQENFMDKEQKDIVLRDIEEADLPLFFEYQLDKDANYMAAFTAKDPTDKDAFMAHWQKILANNTNINRTILVNGQVVGSVSSFMQFGEREVSYWIDKVYWGKGIATKALAAFLDIVTERPLYARAVKDNIGSIRVLQKCGFVITGEDKGFANARSMEVEEYIFMLV
jgi:RimJ/RimL family protein N-acetyltransferase